MGMTLQRLRNYWKLSSELTALQEELIRIANTVHSPATDRENTGSTSPGDPTRQAAMLLAERRDVYEAKQEEYCKEAREITEWIDGLQDKELATIIRYRFSCRYSWKRINILVYGYPSYHTARKRVLRYFGEEN